MNREQIIRMAREAVRLPEPQTPQEEAIERALAPIFERFATLIAAAEREACAKVCDGMDHNGVMIAADCAAAIRARSEQCG
jgi:hypothetical protein